MRTATFSPYIKNFEALIDGPALRWQQDFQNHPLANLIVEFRKFARSYFTFFASDEASTPRELKQVLQRIQLEWEIISRACVQRTVEEFVGPLNRADEIADHYYQQYQGFSEKQSARPVVYFEKVYGITRSPFDPPFALISIPLSVYDNENAWQGLAHEMGHYIYWNSVPLNDVKRLHNGLKEKIWEAVSKGSTFLDVAQQVKLAGVWHAWLEECFADICGVLLAGPIFAVSGQQIVVENDDGGEDALLLDDEAHPLPYIRPLIVLATLDWVVSQVTDENQQEQLSMMIATLRTQWENYLGVRRDEMRKKEHEVGGLTIGTIEDSVTAVVETILGVHGNSWFDANQNADASLGDLLDFTPWLTSLGQIQTAIEVEAEPLFLSRESEPASTFLALRNVIEATHNDNAARREALLGLELYGSGYTCNYRYVKFVGYGNGYYAKCT